MQNYRARKVLIVDDARTMRILLKQTYESKGFLTEEAVDGKEGITKALSGEYDLVIMDIFMPGLSGLDAIRLLRKQQMNIPIIVISSGLNEDNVKSLIKLGITSFLSKPINIPRLIEETNRLLETSDKIKEQ